MPPSPIALPDAPRHVGELSRRARNLTLVAAVLGWMFDGLEMGIFPLIARPALQQMHPPGAGAVGEAFVGHWMGIVTAAFLVGAAFGGWLFGLVGDKLGRVRGMTFAILVYSGCTALTCLVQTPTQLAVVRFLAALGMGGEWSLGAALVSEVWPERFRPLLAALIGAAANVGFVLIAVLGIAFPITATTWRWVVLVGAAPAVLTFLLRLFVPESVRWEEAAAQAPLHPMREIRQGGFIPVLLGAAVLSGIALIGSWGSVQWLPLWADQLAAGQNASAKASVQILNGLGATIGCFAGAWLGHRLGRRQAYFVLSALSLAVCQYFFRTITGYGAGFLGLSFLSGAVTAAFYGWLPLYLPELFPTRVRATCQGIAFNAGRILAAVAAIEMGSLMVFFKGSYPQAGAIITLVYGFGLFVIWLLPETKGKALPP